MEFRTPGRCLGPCGQSDSESRQRQQVRSPVKRRALKSGLLFSLILACATPQSRRDWERSLAAAEHLLNTDQHELAATAYAGLLQDAPRETDARYVRYCQGLVEERLGHWEQAIEHYVQLFEHAELFDDEDEYSARAMYRLGRVYYDDLGDEQEGLAFWKLLLRTYPQMDGPAHRALDAIIVHFEQNESREEAVAYFAQEFPRLEHTRMGDNILYWLGYWHRHYLGDDETALQIFLRLHTQYFDFSGLRDQGDWEIIHIYHERGWYKRELGFLADLRNERQTVFLFGPEVSSSMEQASFRIGQVYLEDLSDPESAIREWRTFLDTWERSLERDDAMYGIVRATMQTGDELRIRETIEEFRQDFTESRWLDEVEAFASELDGA